MSTYDRTLADTQRAIIEAAERRGYERALSEQPLAGEAVEFDFDAVAWAYAKLRDFGCYASERGAMMGDRLNLMLLAPVATPPAAQVQQEAAPFGYLVHRRARLLGDRYFSAADFGKYWDEGSCDGSDRHHSDTFTALYTHPAADTLGAVRELVEDLKASAANSKRNSTTDYEDGWMGAESNCARRLEAALSQAPAVRVADEMANLRSAIMRLDGQSRRDTLVAYRKLEAALGQGKAS